MELLQLKYFCDAAVSENFSATARKFFVPPSCISQSVGRLERELGCALFHHLGNRISLSDAGRRFFRNASAALSLLAEGEAAVRERDGEISGVLDIVCTCSRSTVTDAVGRFTVQYPSVNFLLRHELPKTADFDLLISDRCPFAYKSRTLILDEPICLAMASGHPLAACEQISVASLAGERFISMPEGRSLYEITAEACAAAGFVPNIAIRLEDPSYIRKYVELGLGVAFVPSISWAGLFSDGAVLRPLPGIRRKVYAYLPAERQEKQSCKIFLDILCGIHAKSASDA
jgi:DNA-binding transcriptional LysR family regulator